MKPRRKPKTTPEQFYRATLTDPRGAEPLLLDFNEEERLDVLSTLMFHTIRAYFDGKPPGRWRRRLTLWRYYDHFGPRYRDEIAVIVDAPFNPTRMQAMTSGPHVHQLIMQMCACVVRWRRWSDEDIEAHIAEILRVSALLEQHFHE